jgi:hypothetical protein
VEQEIAGLLELNWNWVLPKPLPTTRNFDAVRVWCATRSPPARRQPIAREHEIECSNFPSGSSLVGKWNVASDLEHEVYPNRLACLGWAPGPWLGGTA